MSTTRSGDQHRSPSVALSTADPTVATDAVEPEQPGRPSQARTLRAALGTMVAASAAPYGYTISIWSSGAVLIRTHGIPHIAEIFAFLAGALSGFGLMGLLAHGALANMESLDHPPDRVLAGALHWLAAGAAVGAVALMAELHGWEAWPLGAFAATTIYILGASAQLALVTTRRRKATNG
jgi:hypothetical protein